MKLLTEFETQISKMGDLRRAWFTSFNADIEFIEKYILPTVVKTERPQAPLDYEALQLALGSSKTDVRIFCDPRFFETHRVKRTCVPVHQVRLGIKDDRFSERSLFHPKVIYLEDTDGKRVIGAGSANLTLSGWGSNVEAFQFFEIRSSANYSSVRRFLNSICRAVKLDGLPIRRKFFVQNEHWKFVHSYQDWSFLDQLFGDTMIKDMAVWSPYLPKDLVGYLDRLEMAADAGEINVHLVSDRMGGQKLRTPWNDEFSNMESTGRLQFYRHPADYDPGERLCHAKIWKLPGKLAVGSWNFTGPGSNIALDDEGNWNPESNVEAGFIINDKHNWEDMCGDRLALGPDNFATQDELEEDGLDVAPLPPFDLRVSFDWAANAYSIEGKWLQGNSSDEYKIILPGVEHAPQLEWRQRALRLTIPGADIEDSRLLVDRVFKILRFDKVVHRGVVYERNADSRRQLVCANLQSLLEGLVYGDDMQSLPDNIFRGTLNCDGLDGDPTPEMSTAIDSGFGGISYFRLFHSMQIYQEKLNAFDDLERLDQQVFVASGSLLELIEKTNAEIEKFGSTIFNNFLAMEVAALCDLAHARKRSLVRKPNWKKRKYTPIPNDRWKVQLAVDPVQWPKGTSPEYAKHIVSQIRDA